MLSERKNEVWRENGNAEGGREWEGSISRRWKNVDGQESRKGVTGGQEESRKKKIRTENESNFWEFGGD